MPPIDRRAALLRTAAAGLVISHPTVSMAAVREIDLARETGPIVIDEPGRYRFSGHFVGSLGDYGGAVLVRSDFVDLDFRFASIVNTFGPRTLARAVFTDRQPVTGVSVRRLKTRGFLDMVRLIGDGLLVEDVMGQAYNRGVQTEGDGSSVVRRVHVLSCGGANFSEEYYRGIGIEQNVAEANTEDCIVIDCFGRGEKAEGVGISHTGRGTIQGNVVRNNLKAPHSYAVWVSRGSDVVVKSNHFENYQTGIPLPTGSPVTAYNNTYRNVDVPRVGQFAAAGDRVLA